MADHTTLIKARKELEDMYSGIPDDSVNLTFGDLVQVTPGHPLERKMSFPLEPVNKVKKNKSKTDGDVAKAELTKLPSLDFSRALEATAKNHQYNKAMAGHPFVDKTHLSPINPSPSHQQSPYHGGACDDKSCMNISGMSMGASVAVGRRPGIPHSNICTLCSNYIYMCKHRCLVCGRAYCKHCGVIGMGEMTEGRKCLECLGKKFSHRYIHRAGEVSCCMRFKYSSKVVQQELKWADKGPRKTGERRYGQSRLVSPLRSPMAPKTPMRPKTPMTPRNPMTPRTPTWPGPNQGPRSFVSSPYSTYTSPINHSLPF